MIWIYIVSIIESIILFTLAFRIAESRGLSGGRAILMSLFLTPIVSMIYYGLVNPEWVKKQEAMSMKKSSSTSNDLDPDLILGILFIAIVVIIVVLCIIFG